MQKRIGLFFLSFIAVAALLVVTTASSSDKRPVMASPQSPAANGFAVVELFTSQGCSSCPPADALLGEYAMANDAQLIPIAFHVDYWNRFGWKDPFSNPLFSQRQWEYTERFNKDGVYTPQAVVNGVKEMLGSDESLLKIAIARAKATAPTATIHITAVQQKKDSIYIDYTIAGAFEDASLQAVLVQRQVKTHIKAGENRGLSLTNYHIARDLKSLPASATGQVQLTLPETKDKGAFKIVLFVQAENGKITGVMQREVVNE